MTPETEDVQYLKRLVTLSVFTPMLVVAMISALAWFVGGHRIERHLQTDAAQQLRWAVSSYERAVASNLAIIAHAPIFLTYLRANATTQKALLPRFEAPLMNMDTHAVTGMQITDLRDHQTRFQYGNPTPDRMTLKLCFSHQSLNPQTGTCRYHWTLYFSKTALLNALEKINHHITPCPTCTAHPIFTEPVFGTHFPVVSTQGLNVHVKIWQASDLIERDSEAIWLALLLAAILVSIGFCHQLIDRFYRYQAEIKEKDRLIQTHEAEKEKCFRKAAHDMQSPTMAIEIAMQGEGLEKKPNETRAIVKQALQRIQDIAYDLKSVINEAHTSHETRHPTLVLPLVESILSEKRMAWRRAGIQFKLHIQKDVYPVYESFVNLNARMFRRVLSNLIDNAIDAITDEGRIDMHLHATKDVLHLQVKDTGHGIPRPVLPKVFQGRSFGKPHGSGVGLSSAKESIESWGGTIAIDSTIDHGTDVIIALPKSVAPPWFPSIIPVWQGHEVIVLDDDPTIHDAWQQRFFQLIAQHHDDISQTTHTSLHEILTSPSPMRLHTFLNASELTQWHQQHGLEKGLVLCDYELEEGENGLDVIERLGITAQSILVTSHFQRVELQQRCMKLNVKLMPKSLMAYMPIKLLTDNPELIYLDDDKGMTSVWQLQADMCHKNIVTFNQVSDFLRVVPFYDKATPIYLDAHLEGDTCQGDQLGKALDDMGYHTLYLVTGDAPSQYTHCHWFNDILGKHPPF